MTRQVTIKASEERVLGQLLKRVHHSDEHLIVEDNGSPVAVIMSYEEYAQLSHLAPKSKVEPTGMPLPSVLTLEEAFGSVTPLNQPEDFAALRDAAIEEHVQQVVAKMKEN